MDDQTNSGKTEVRINPSQQTGENLGQINRDLEEMSALRHAHDLGLPYVDISKTPLNPDFLKIMEIEEAKKLAMVPFFKVGKKIRVAVADPENASTKEALKKLEIEGYEVSLNLASAKGIADALEVYQKSMQYKKIEIVDTIEEKSLKTYEKEIAGLKDLPEKIKQVTTEEALNLINLGAIKTGASDLHYEPTEKVVNVRFRIDGLLHKVFEIDLATYKNLLTQVKYESKMKLNVVTVPQDGRYDFHMNEDRIAVRVSSIPTPYGESLVCRYLISGEKPMTFEELGFQGLALEKLKEATDISHGMILVTGPTGSGKTTTLYALLNVMNSPESKIITLEDPVEYSVEGVTQSQIDEKRGYDFASGLRAILRQDPDIVMLGEIRDLETDQTAAQASLTGHVLLSTLHTNSAIESIPRLINMGLPAFMVAPAMDTIIAQRLVRKVCSACATKKPISESEKKEFNEVVETVKSVSKNAELAVPENLPEAKGCDVCSQTGYKGRLVVHEVVKISDKIKEAILNGEATDKLFELARNEGMLTMREDGFLKVTQGLTTLEEVYRVTNIEK